MFFHDLNFFKANVLGFVLQTFWSRKKCHIILKAFVYSFVEYVAKEMKCMKPSLGGLADKNNS